MITVHDDNGQKLVIASELFNILELNITHYSRVINQWFKEEYLFQKEDDFRTPKKGIEFSPYKAKTSKQGGRPKKDYYITLELSKLIALDSRSKFKKVYVKWLLGLEAEVQDGKRLNSKELLALLDVAMVGGHFSISKQLESEIYYFMGKPTDWWEKRAEITGYSKSKLQETANKLGFKYRSQRQVLIRTNPYEIVRIALVDYLILLGKSKIYAQNAAQFTMDTIKATGLKLDIREDKGDTIDFKSNRQKAIIHNIKNRQYLLN